MSIVEKAKAEDQIRLQTLAEIRKMLGSRIRSVVTGGAATPPHLKDFLDECFGSMVSEGFACSEVGPVTNEGTVMRDITFKLVDVPDLGYTSKDMPYPRGEFCIKRSRMINEYFNDPEATKNGFDEEGYFHTGDIVELLEIRKIRVIDRKKNFFKVSQGEFVTPEKIEGIYRLDPIVNQVLVTSADVVKYNHLGILGVIVPNKDVLLSVAKENGFFPSDQETCSDQEFHNLCSNSSLTLLVLHRLNQHARQHLRSFELLHGIMLESSCWSMENGSLTSSFKLSRPNLTVRYREAIDQLAEKLHALSLVSGSSSSSSSSSDSTRDVVLQTISEVLKQPLSDLDLSRTFSAQGGADSLSGMLLLQLLKDRLGITVSPFVLLGNATSIEEIVQHCEGKKGSSEKEDLVSSHSVLQQMIKDSEIDLHQLILEGAPVDDMEGPCGGWTLLTGSTGFLGIFILRDLLLNTQANVICSVRAVDAEKALERLMKTCTMYGLSEDDDFMDIIEEGKRVQVITGDLERKFLGLSKEDFLVLASRVKTIYHNGAIVNHMLPYESLREANVLGTVEMIRLALCRKQRTFFHYISTISVRRALENKDSIFTVDRLDHASKVTGGYEQTKAVSEVILSRTFSEFKDKFTASLFRPGMISWSTSTGRGNLKDWFCRLVVGMIEMGSAPRPLQPRYSIDLLSVDDVASIVVVIGDRLEETRRASKITTVQGPFNTGNKENLTWANLIEWISQAAAEYSEEFGDDNDEDESDYNVQNAKRLKDSVVSFDVWKRQLDGMLKESATSNPKLSGLTLFSNGLPEPDSSFYYCSFTFSSVGGSRAVIHEIDFPLVRKMVFRLLALWPMIDRILVQQ